MDNVEYISIIIAAHNSAGWISRTLDSVLRAADKDCEIVVVDDGSTDETAAIVHKYEDRDPRIILVELPEQCGVAAARRAGVESCTGDSVIFVDSDDLLPADAIANMRRDTEPGVDLLICNVSMRALNRTSRLTLSGHAREITGNELAILLLHDRIDTSILGKKIARRLFFIHNWETNPLLTGVSHRSLMLTLACAIGNGKVAIRPAVLAYIHVERKGSISSLFNLRYDGIRVLWRHVNSLPLPKDAIISWGLHLFETCVLRRGMPMSNDYDVLHELLAMSRHAKNLTEQEQHTLAQLRNPRFRLRHAQKMTRLGRKSANTAHVSFIIAARNNYHAVNRSVQSIFDTGYRNIEIIIIDNASDGKTALRLNELHIKYPAIIVRKMPHPDSVSACYGTGVEQASGTVVIFVKAGDIVRQKGTFEAIIRVDDGADIALMGVRRGMSHRLLSRNLFLPSQSGLVSGDLDTTLDTIVGRERLPISPCYMAIRRDFLKPDMFVRNPMPVGDTYLTVLHMMFANPKIEYTDETGCYTQSIARIIHVDATIRCQCKIALVQYMLTHLGEDNETHRRLRTILVNRLTNEISYIVRSYRRNIFNGSKKARELAGHLLADPDTKHIYDSVNLPLPSSERLLHPEKARPESISDGGIYGAGGVTSS